MNPRTRQWFKEYADAHRHPVNRLTHKVAIPVIVFHVLAMLDWIPLAQVGAARVSAAHVGWVLAAATWTTLLPRSGLLLSVATLPVLALAPVTPRGVVVALAVVGWAVQLAGHRVWERNQPAFLKNLLQALIGPLFFVAVGIGEWPLRPAGQAGPHDAKSPSNL